MKKISIIVPIYNAEKYLDECIQSVLNEIDESVELLLIDDGSEDDSWNICKRYKRENIRVFNNKNHGVSYSRNFGIEIAQGDFILFLDADDFLLKGWKRAIDKALENDFDVGYFTCSKMAISKLDILDSMIGFPSCSLKNMAGILDKIYRRKFILDNKIRFNENIINGEDELFNIQVILATEHWCFIEQFIYFYRQNNLSASHTFNEKFIDSNDLFLRELRQVLLGCHFLSKEQINEYLDFCFLSSVYILIVRIYAIKNKKERNDKLNLLERKDFRSFLENYRVNPKFGKRLNKVAALVKNRKYNSLFRDMKLRRIVKLIIEMVER